MGERSSAPQDNEVLRQAFAIPNSDRSPLYDVRNPARASCEGQRMRSDVFADDGFDETTCRSSIPSGGARRDRTDDLMLAKHALSQLSYGHVPEDECCCLARLACLAVARGSKSAFALRASARQPSLRFAREGWWAWEDLNFRPHAYQARALTN